MNKGISFYFGFVTNPEERAKMIKDTGFDCVITSYDKKFDCQNGTLASQMKLFKKYGLKVSSLHMSYNEEDLPYFFLKGLKGYLLERRLIKDVKLAKKYGFTCVVVHLGGRPSKVGVDRLKRVLKVCHETNIPLAIENLQYNDPFFAIFKQIDDPYLKFCWDVGHSHFASNDFDFIKEYGDKLIALHLHDNDGTSDMHTLNKYGTNDWRKIAKSLASLDRDINLDYEVLMVYRQNETASEVATTVYNQACELDKMIEEERAKLHKKA